jgi:hypothetical protein
MVRPLTADMIKRAYAPAGATHRVLSPLRHMFKRGRKWREHLFGESPLSDLSPALCGHRDRSLCKARQAVCWRALKAEPPRLAAKAAMLRLLTGTRKREISPCPLGLVPISKTDRPRSVVLNAAAMEILKGLRRTKGNSFIFVAANRPSHSELAALLGTHSRPLRLKNVRPYALPPSCASSRVNEGVSRYLVQGLPAHRCWHRATPRSSRAQDIVRGR